VAVVAVALGLVPRQVWEMDPVDLATVVDVLEDQSRRR
jgi:Phage tail assembly chaperone protein, TAC